MRLAVSGNGYTSATNEFLDTNHLTATTAHALMDALAHTGAMAGHTANDWAASYDQAAHQGITALTDLVDALANLARLSETTRRNHAHAEARAVTARHPTLDETPPALTCAHVAPRLPPTAAGTHTPQLPHWAAWILDQIEGFIWPDSDTDRLHTTARAWRTAAADLELTKTRCLDAAFSLSIETAPDVDLAADAVRRLATHVDSLAQSFLSLASSCEDLADQVHHHRQQVLDIIEDTIRDAVIIEGIGIVLGAVTGGITAAAATSVNSARIAAIAPRIIHIIDALRIAIGASETGARLAADAVIEVRTSFQAFIRARVILTDRGCAGIPFGPLIDSVETRVSRAVPATTDAKLGNYVRNLFKGVTREDRVGDGTTMDAIRHERATGLMTQGKMHIMKGEETLRGLERWLGRNPDASPSDVAIARQLIAELKDVLG
jgi:hypothetical protein